VECMLAVDLQGCSKHCHQNLLQEVPRELNQELQRHLSRQVVDMQDPDWLGHLDMPYLLLVEVDSLQEGDNQQVAADSQHSQQAVLMDCSHIH